MQAELRELKAHMVRERSAVERSAQLFGRTPSVVEANQCSVCMTLMVDACTLGCGHSGCLGCMQIALARGERKCPMCRAVHPQAIQVNVLLRDSIERMCRGDASRAAAASTARAEQADGLASAGELAAAAAAFRRAAASAPASTALAESWRERSAQPDAEAEAAAAAAPPPPPAAAGGMPMGGMPDFSQMMAQMAQMPELRGGVNMQDPAAMQAAIGATMRNPQVQSMMSQMMGGLVPPPGMAAPAAPPPSGPPSIDCRSSSRSAARPSRGSPRRAACS